MTELMGPITCVLSILIATMLYSELGEEKMLLQHKPSKKPQIQIQIQSITHPFFFLAMNASLFVWACYVKKRKTVALFLRTSLYVGIVISTSDILCGLAMVYLSISTFFMGPSREPYLAVDLSKLSPYWNAVRTLLFAFSVSCFFRSLVNFERYLLLL